MLQAVGSAVLYAGSSTVLQAGGTAALQAGGTAVLQAGRGYCSAAGRQEVLQCCRQAVLKCCRQAVLQRCNDKLNQISWIESNFCIEWIKWTKQSYNVLRLAQFSPSLSSTYLDRRWLGRRKLLRWAHRKKSQMLFTSQNHVEVKDVRGFLPAIFSRCVNFFRSYIKLLLPSLRWRFSFFKRFFTVISSSVARPAVLQWFDFLQL